MHADRRLRAVRRAVWLLLAAVALGCGGGAAPPKARPAPRGQPPEKPESARDRLLAALRTVDRGGAVLEVSSVPVRQLFESFREGLTPDEQEAILKPDGPAVAVRPITHLVLGGTSAKAYYQIAVGDLAELVIGAGDRISKAEQLASARELKRRAAAHFLRERAVDVGSDGGPTVAVCDEIDRVAILADRRDIARAARVMALELESTAIRRLAVAEAAAWDLDAKGARAELARAPAKDGEPARTRRYRDRVELAVEAVERVAAAEGKAASSPEEAVAVGRALIRLGRRAEALSALEPHRGRAASHLAVAGVLARASIGSVCPDLPGSATPALCGAAWLASPDVKRTLPIVQQAWASKAGRDVQAVETYLGLVHVVPSMYGFLGAQVTSAEGAAKAFAERVEKFGVAADEVKDLSPQFEGLRLFVDTLGAAVAAMSAVGAGERPQVPEQVTGDLRERAKALAERAPDDRMVQAAVLGVACVFSQRLDALPLVELLPSEVAYENRVPRATALLWSSVAHRRDDIAEKGRAELLSLAESLDEVRRAELILLMAEADAARLRTPEKLKVLERVSVQLARPSSPVTLRLRALLDVAGAKARNNNRAEAIDVLEKATLDLSGDPVAQRSSLLLLAKSYLIALRALEAEGDERAELQKKLADLVDPKTPPGAIPDSVLVWRDLWVAELGFLRKSARCGPNKICVGRAKKTRDVAWSTVDERVGAQAGTVVRGGTLAAGSVRLSFNFSDSGELQPLVTFEPRLLAVEVPPAK